MLNILFMGYPLILLDEPLSGLDPMVRILCRFGAADSDPHHP